MLITNHVLTGAVVGAFTASPGRALVTGFASHFVLDTVPHFGVDDEHLMKVAVPDGLLGLGAIAMIARVTPRDRLLPVLAGVCGACLPDLDKPGQVFFGRSPFPAWFDRVHAKIQDEGSHRIWVELSTAAAAGATLAGWLCLRQVRLRRGERRDRRG